MKKISCKTCDNSGPYDQDNPDDIKLIKWHQDLGHDLVEISENLKNGVRVDTTKPIIPYTKEESESLKASFDAENRRESEHSLEEIAEFGRNLFTNCSIDANDNTKIHATVKLEESFETIDLDSKLAQDILIQKYYGQHKKIINENIVKSAIAFIKTQKLYLKDTPKKEIYHRIKSDNNVIWYDLCDPKRRIVKITKEKFDIIEYDPSCPVFIKTPHMAEQVIPNFNYKGNPLNDLCILMRQPNNNYFKCHMINLFIEHIETPIILFEGGSGNAKSTASMMVKELVDPSGSSESDNLSILPNNEIDFATILSQSYFTVFDNVDKIDKKQNGWICRGITGSSLDTRMLYKQGEIHRLKFRRKIGINAIAPDLNREELQRRCISYIFNTIPSGEIKSKVRILKQFKELLPDVLGQIFTVLQEVLKIIDRVESEVKEHSSLADFVIYCEATSQSLGQESGKFVESHKIKLNHNSDELERLNPIITFLDTKFVDKVENYSDAVSNFFNEFSVVASSLGFDIHNSDLFPSSVGKLDSFFRISSTILKSNYYGWSFRKLTKKELHNGNLLNPNVRIIEIKKIKEVLFA